MRDKNSNIDDEQNYQPISRRNLIKLGGSAAGIAAAGGIPSATGIEYPVGDADALVGVSGAAIILAGAGISAAISHYAIQKNLPYVTGDPGDIAEDSDRQYIHSAIVDRSNLDNDDGSFGELYGVFESDGSVSWDNKKSNSHRLAMLNDAKKEVALAYTDGMSRQDAVIRGQNKANQISLQAELSLLNWHNDFVRQFADVAKRASEYEDDDIFTIPDDDFGNSDPTPQGVLWDQDNVSPIQNADGDPYGATNQTYGDDRSADTTAKLIYTQETAPSDYDPKYIWDFDKKPTIVADWNNKDILSNVDSLVPDRFKPDNIFCSMISFQNGGVLSPYATCQNKLKYHPIPRKADPGTDDMMEGQLITDPILESNYNSIKKTVNYNWIVKSMEAIRRMRVDVLSSIRPFLRTVYDALDNGEVDASDVIPSVNLYQQLEPSEETSLYAVFLASMGISGGISNTFTVEIDSSGKQYSGNLFIDSQNSFDLAVGSQISASEYNRIHIIRESGRKTVSDVGFTIVEVNGDGDSGETISYEESDQFADLDSVSEDDVAKSIKRDQQNVEELEQRIEELENDGLLGGGGSGSGLGSNSLILGALGLGGAYVLFGGGS